MNRKLHRRIATSQRGRHLEIPIDRVLLGGADVDAMRVEERRQLAGVGKADAYRRAGLPRHPAAAKQTLEVDDEIELAAAEALS
jgi:hypothetical protein